MKNKYFTPNIEDLYVGYECEIKEVVEDSNTKSGYNLEWVPYIIGINNIGTSDIKVNSGSIRTPYLSEEQIINEGWTHHYDDFTFGVFWKEIDENWDYSLEYDYTYHRLLITIISKDDMKILSTKFSGECKSINELRTIFKFLKIK